MGTVNYNCPTPVRLSLLLTAKVNFAVNTVFRVFSRRFSKFTPKGNKAVLTANKFKRNYFDSYVFHCLIPTAQSCYR